MAVCSECEADVDVDEFDVDRDDELSCSACGANFVVKAVSPLDIEFVTETDAFEESADEDGDGDDWV